MNALSVFAFAGALLLIGCIFFMAHLWANGTRRQGFTDFENHGGE